MAADEPTVQLNDLQNDFVLWNAERLGLTHEDSLARFTQSMSHFRGGHGGRQYRRFNDLSYSVFSPFFGDEEGEIGESYVFHSYMHFLRMLSYRFEPWPFADDLLSYLTKQDTPTVLDYGCGLAQSSRWICKTLKAKGLNVSLALVDFPTLRQSFLEWWCAKEGISVTFHAAAQGGPVTGLPMSHVCIATEFFEHVRNPEVYFRVMDQSLAQGGWLITNVNDHKSEFMHVSPDLRDLRAHIHTAGYEEMQTNRVFLKAK